MRPKYLRHLREENRLLNVALPAMLRKQAEVFRPHFATSQTLKVGAHGYAVVTMMAAYGDLVFKDFKYVPFAEIVWC